jgi:hypothetical protein
MARSVEHTQSRRRLPRAQPPTHHNLTHKAARRISLHLRARIPSVSLSATAPISSQLEVALRRRRVH